MYAYNIIHIMTTARFLETMTIKGYVTSGDICTKLFYTQADHGQPCDTPIGSVQYVFTAVTV